MLSPERLKVPEIKLAIDDAIGRCVKAIENERADTIILGCIPLQCREEELRY
jgi:Asp/Glu/hydantoin racemase